MKDTKFLANFFVKRVDDRMDSVMAVDSGYVKGTGKTVFSIDTSKALCNHKKVNYPYSMEKLMLLNATTDKLISLIKKLPYGVPIHIDEAIFIAYKRDYNEDPVKKLVKFINICRKYRKPILLNTPSFWDLDKDIRNLCEFRATVVRRGIACIRGRHPNPEYEDQWIREESKKVIDKEIGSDITDFNGVIRGISKCRNHLFNIIYPDLPKKEYEKYERMSKREEGKQLIMDEKRIYPLVKAVSYYILSKCYVVGADGKYKRVNTSILNREINLMVSKSQYAQQFSKFRTTRSTWRNYKKDWKDVLEEGEGVSVSGYNNNNNIPIEQSKEPGLPKAIVSSQPEELGEPTEQDREEFIEEIA